MLKHQKKKKRKLLFLCYTFSMLRKHSKGFTLIELLVVIAIIGVLATMVTASLGEARERARRAKLLATIRDFQVALELYHADNNEYPNRDAEGGGNYTLGGNGYPTMTQNWEEFRTKMGPYFNMDRFEEAFVDVGLFHMIRFHPNPSVALCPTIKSGGPNQTYGLRFNLINAEDPIEPYFNRTSGNWHWHCASG